MTRQIHRIERHIGGQGAKIAAIAIIWPCTVALLALCIPIVKATKSEFVPLAVILGATGTTAIVWFSPHTVASGKRESQWESATGERLGQESCSQSAAVVTSEVFPPESMEEKMTTILPLW